MAENPSQCSAISLDKTFKHALGPAVEAPLFRLWFVVKQTSAHHGSQCERDGGRDEDRNGERDGELAEQPTHNVPHEKQRNEHCDEGYCEADAGKANLLLALAWCIQ